MYELVRGESPVSILVAYDGELAPGGATSALGWYEIFTGNEVPGEGPADPDAILNQT